jgi:hypothetical protein
MKILDLRQKTDSNGHLRLDLPVGNANAECDVVVVVEPSVAPAEWLPGFWDQLSHGWEGEPLTRPPQGEFETRSPLR